MRKRGSKDRDVAETLLLQEHQLLLLVIVSNYDLFNHFQDMNTNTDAAPRQCGGRVLLRDISAAAQVHRHVIPGGLRTSA
jgi:hypothetical protein